VGAAYLVYLGVRLLMRQGQPMTVPAVASQGARRAWVDVVAVFAAHRLLKSGAARATRARLMTHVSGVTMVALGAFLALARREA
jgi:threonine/homoserine/homoserine lactone efflux protein